MMIKDDVKQWQKDYVAVLLELEERLNVSEKTLKSLEERLSADAVAQVHQEPDSPKAFSASPYAPHLPRFDPGEKK